MAIGVARQSFNLIFGFGLSIPVFFVTTNAWILWFAVRALVARFRYVRRRRRDREAGRTQGPGDSAAGRHGPGGVGDPAGPGADVEPGGDAG
jgi:hypothetical protein